MAENGIVISLDNLFQAEVTYFKNDIYAMSGEKNYSYILWYDEIKSKLILIKSKPNSKTTDLEYVNTYRSIEEYYEQDLSKNQEHFIYYEGGLYDEIKDFLEKYGKDKILSHMEKEKLNYFERKAQRNLGIKEGMSQAFAEKEINEADEKRKSKMLDTNEARTKEEKMQAKQRLFEQVKSRILKLKYNREEIFLPDETLVDIQQKLKERTKFTFKEIDVYAKNIIKMFWDEKVPDDEHEIEVLLHKIIDLDVG